MLSKMTHFTYYFNVTLNLSQIQVTLYLSDRQQTLTVPQEIWHSDEQDD